MEITEEKIKITIRDIMVDFETQYQEYIDILTILWRFKVPSIQEIKKMNYDLYDRLWVNCFTTDYGVRVSKLELYKHEIQDISQKISEGK